MVLAGAMLLLILTQIVSGYPDREQVEMFNEDILAQMRASNELRANRALDAKHMQSVKAKAKGFNEAGLTCRASDCLSPAEYFGTSVHFCQSHMMIAVAS